MTRTLLLCCSLVAALSAQASRAAELTVAPDGSAEYGSITEALAAAVVGDVGALAPGT